MTDRRQTAEERQDALWVDGPREGESVYTLAREAIALLRDYPEEWEGSGAEMQRKLAAWRIKRRQWLDGGGDDVSTT